MSSSLNPSLALKSTAYRRCFFSPAEEHHAFRWGSAANSSADFAQRSFLPDTLKRLT